MFSTKSANIANKVVRLTTSRKGYGGNIYERMIDDALIEKFGSNYSVQYNTFNLSGYARLIEAPLYLIRNLLFSLNPNVTKIRSLQTAFFNLNGAGLTIVYHVDSSHSPTAVKFFQEVVEKWFFGWISKTQHIVVISKYWQEYFATRGFKNIHLVYCGYDIEQYNPTQEAVEQFKKSFELSGRIVYIGNPQKKKGTDQVYEALKNDGYTLVCSGEGDLNLPVKKLRLSFKEYICLLKASDAVVTMSQFLEGWNRVAHEAMLVGTPVVGSGSGGMAELLEGGEQLICNEFSELSMTVKKAILNRHKFSKTGKNYAEKFTLEKFNSDWVKLIDQINKYSC